MCLYSPREAQTNVRKVPIVPKDDPQPAAEPLSVSEWAQKRVHFSPSPKQAEVLDSTSKYLILCCNRQWGKTTTIAVKALHFCLHTPNQCVIVLATSMEQAGMIVERAIECAVLLGLPTPRFLGRKHSLALPNGSRIVAIPHTETTSLGRTANVLIVDEAAVVKDSVFYAIGAVVSRAHGRMWLLSTPSRQAGFFYNFWHDKDSGFHKVLSPVSDCPEIDPQYLAMLRRASPTKYAQQFECQFTQPADYLTNREFVRSVLRKAK